MTRRHDVTLTTVHPDGSQQQGLVVRSRSSSILGIVYLVIGVVVASSHAYFVNLTAVMPLLSAVLAVVLWPLVLLGVSLHLH